MRASRYSLLVGAAAFVVGCSTESPPPSPVNPGVDTAAAGGTDGETGAVELDTDTDYEPERGDDTDGSEPACKESFDEEGICVCEGAQLCQPTCELDDCNATCQETAYCVVGCADAVDCGIACSGSALCSVECEDSASCQLSCSDSSDCSATCGPGQCELACEDAAYCTFDCGDAQTCAVTCRNDAVCKGDCGDATACAFACSDNGQCDVTCEDGQECDLSCDDTALCRCRGPGCRLDCPEGDPVPCEAPYDDYVACDVDHCNGELG